MKFLSNYTYYLFVVLCTGISLIGCKDKDDDLTTSPDEVVKLSYDITYLYIPDGIGDMSYTDLLFAYFSTISDLVDRYYPTSSEVDTVTFKHMMPSTLDQSTLFIKEWDKQEVPANTRRLLVLTSDIFLPGIQSCNNWRHDKNTKVLMLDDINSKDESLYTIRMSLYGPAWEAGYLLRSSKIYDSQAIAILVADKDDLHLIEAVDGWKDGYAAASDEHETTPDIPVIVIGQYSDEARAMQLSDSLILKANKRHIVCFAGAAQKGVLRSIDNIRSAQGESSDLLATICESSFSSYWKPMIACQIRKDMGGAYMNWFNNWMEDKLDLMDRNMRLTMESRIDYALSNNICLDLVPLSIQPESDDQMSSIRQMASDAEKKYLGL